MPRPPSKKALAAAQQVECLKSGAPNCAACPLAKDGHPPHTPVPPSIPVAPKGILVGEGPGRTEAQQGRVFVGSTGQQLTLELSNVGLKREDLAIVNATGCLPPANKSERMMKLAVQACQGLFWRHMNSLNPELPTLAMGQWAHFALTGEYKSVMEKRGFIEPRSPCPTLPSQLPLQSSITFTAQSGAEAKLPLRLSTPIVKKA